VRHAATGPAWPSGAALICNKKSRFRCRFIPFSAGALWVVLDGGAGAATLIGSAGDDMLFGGADADQLTGWLGSDYFSGGDGTDTFTDFNSGEGDMSDGS
jgi:Ca2+-binding RTX toxin-like protein